MEVLHFSFSCFVNGFHRNTHTHTHTSFMFAKELEI